MQTQEFRDLARELKDNLSRLQSKRQNWESHWQEVADYMLPRKSDINRERSKGDKRNIQIFDSTAVHSLELLSSSLHGMLTSQANRWFQLRYKEAILNDSDEAKEWLEDAMDKMYIAFARSNFQQEVFEAYHDLIAFGTSCLFIEEDQDDIIRFSSRHIKEIYITENEKGFVDTMYRKFKMTAKAALERFGKDSVSRDLLVKFQKTPFDDIELVHVVKPRSIIDPRKLDKKNMPFQSVYMEFETGHIISIGGFREFPYVVPRYLKASNEIYGRSPGMNSLADVKVLNKMVEVSMKAAQKQVDPPLLVPDDAMILPIRTAPGSLNYYRSGSRDRIEALNIGANNPLGLNMEDQRRRAISRTFHVDQLLIQENRTMTATEVMQRNQEKMKILGPVIGRLQQELLQPLITRVFNIMLRTKQFLPAPEALTNQEVDIEYVSPVAIAQKGSQLESIMRGLELFGSISNIAPVTDYIDENGLVKQIINILGLPAKMIKSDKQVQEVRAVRQEQQAAQAQMQMEMMQSEQAKNAAPLVQAINGKQQ
nr:head-tail connector protein [uncultured Mediterranean phage uvMED]